MSFYAKLSPVEQFEVVAFVAAACVFFAVILRELFQDREIQIAARSLGLIGFALLGAFAYRMAATVEVHQQFAKKAKNVSQAGDSVFVVAHQVKTKNGTTLEWTSDRRSDWTVWTAGGRIRGGCHTNGSCDCFGAGTCRCSDAMPDESRASATDDAAKRITEAGKRF